MRTKTNGLTLKSRLKPSQKYLECQHQPLGQFDASNIGHNAGSGCVAIDVDEARTSTRTVALPTDREGSALRCASPSDLRWDELTDADLASAGVLN
jgi:hypothetical protein